MKYLATAALAAWIAAPAWAADPGVTDTEIRIGDVNIMTGPASFIGRAVSIGSKIAAAEINAAGGVNGRKIVVVTEDDGYVSARSFQAPNELIYDPVRPSVFTIGASYSDAFYAQLK